MNLDKYQKWLEKFVKFRLECQVRLGKPVPNEISQLKAENQTLPELYARAQDFAADAISYYYSAKLEHIERMDAIGWAKTSLTEVAKACSYKQLWSREASERLVQVIKDRIYTVYRSLEMEKP